ncbi:MAG: hypothetical protein ABIB71_07245 [Candidatus Woesearchaeota archaeon]
MEETMNDQKNTTAYQLKKLLGKKEKQDLGNVERWKQIPVEYIVTANTLGIELNDYALKRLNDAEDKEHAFESIYVTQYFAKEARKLKKLDLANKLEAMVEDESIATEDIAFYATKAIENELPKEKVLKKLAKAYTAKANVPKRTIQAKESKEEALEDKLNEVNIVLVPVDADGFCNAYIDYEIKGRKSLENTVVNIYCTGELDEDAVNKAINIAGEEIYSKIKDKISCNFGGEAVAIFGLLSALADGVGCVVGLGVGVAIDRVIGTGNEGARIGALTGAGLIQAAMFGLAGHAYFDFKMEQKLGKKLKGCPNINVIKSKELENLWNVAFKNAEPKEIREPLAKKAMLDSIDKSGAASVSYNLSPKIKDAYNKKMELTNKFEEKKEKEENLKRKEEEQRLREEKRTEKLVRINAR